MRVLVVSEHPEVRNGLARLIKAEVESASVHQADASHARSIADETRPRVAVLDVRVPAVSGLQLCEELRSLPVPPRVILIASALDEWFRGRALAAGASAVLLKDLDTSNLLKEVTATSRAPWP